MRIKSITRRLKATYESNYSHMSKGAFKAMIKEEAYICPSKYNCSFVELETILKSI